jgi:hypothetical protein
MGKRLDITPKIAAAIARSTDGSVDPATVAVFETGALNTLPLSKKGTLFDQGRVTETTMRQMADYLNKGTDYAPLHKVHDQAEGGMPVGRVFAGEVIPDADGNPELRCQFYLPLDTEASLINKLDTAVQEEVSVGLQAQHINCSECGFDYLGAEATWEHIYFRQCPNEHTVGENGVHTIMNGMKNFLELSLVSRGAAKGTKIYSRAKAALGEEGYKQLAANGSHMEATILFASPTTLPKKEHQMDMTVLVEKLTTAQASVLVKDAELVTEKAANTALTAKVTDLTAQVATLTASADVTKVTGLETQLAAATASVTAALTFVRAEADRLAVASGLTKPAADANLETLTASITTSRTKLQETLPVGGKANDANSGAGDKQANLSAVSYKTKR